MSGVLLFEDNEQPGGKQSREGGSEEIKAAHEAVQKAAAQVGTGKTAGGEVIERGERPHFAQVPAGEAVVTLAPPEKPGGRALGGVIVRVGGGKPGGGLPRGGGPPPDRLRGEEMINPPAPPAGGGPEK